MRKKHLFLLTLLLFAGMIFVSCGTAEEPVADPISEEQVVDEPAAEEQAVEETTADEAVAEEPATEETAAEEPADDMVASTYIQSPFLDGRDLPSVDERLPENPMVIAPLAGEDQQYGGNLRIGFVGDSPAWGAFLYVALWEQPMQWNSDFSGVEPALLEELEVNEDATEYTFHIREGIRWSDGEPYTADDIMFYLEDVSLNEELNPSGLVADWIPSDMAADFRAEKIDDYTVKFIFPEPYGTFPYQLAAWGGRYFGMYPKHYLTQFHKEFNPDVDALVEGEEGVEDWVGLFFKLGPDSWANPDRFFQNPEMPTLGPWVTVQPMGTGTTLLLERNPYYYKVDPDGHQLPYIDEVTGISYQDSESRTLAMLNGDLDHIKDPANEDRVLFHDALDEGRPLQIKYPSDLAANTLSIYMNQSYADPVKAELFASKDFRIGLSHAINREEIIEIVYNGQGIPAQSSPLEDSPLYNEQLATQFLEYDVDLANEYLDMVIPERDADGYRLGPDGNPLEIVFSVSNDLTFGTNWVQTAELLIGYWDAVGVKFLLNSIPDDQFSLNKEQNEIEVTVYAPADGAGITPILSHRDFVPLDFFSMFGVGWYYWRVQQANTVQVEPPDWAQEIRADFNDSVVGAPTYEGQLAAMSDILQIAADEFWVIGISRPPLGYYPFHSRMGGIPETWYDGWTAGSEKVYRPEQWYLMDDEA
ncbi:MAG: ABC transporter substrate-binding protein [Ardenticatenaceae bacterium]|nr:ABC transporter substrate-binding protein [Ardenticatenaceae bacterium]